MSHRLLQNIHRKYGKRRSQLDYPMESSNIINSFNQLSTVFMKHCSMFIAKGASDTDMWTMSKKKEESLGSFNGRLKTILSNMVARDVPCISKPATSKYALYKVLWPLLVMGYLIFIKMLIYNGIYMFSTMV